VDATGGCTLEGCLNEGVTEDATGDAHWSDA
jgi:hypothetical protein